MTIERFPNGTAIVPATGEVVNLNDPEDVAKVLTRVRVLEAQLGEMKRLLTQELVAHTRHMGERTTTLPGGQRVVREGGPVREYNAGEVERGLREAGAPDELIQRVVQRVITVKVNGTEAQKAARANPEYKRVIDAATTEVDKPYTIRLT